MKLLSQGKFNERCTNTWPKGSAAYWGRPILTCNSCVLNLNRKGYFMKWKKKKGKKKKKSTEAWPQVILFQSHYNVLLPSQGNNLQNCKIATKSIQGQSKSYLCNTSWLCNTTVFICTIFIFLTIMNDYFDCYLYYFHVLLGQWNKILIQYIFIYKQINMYESWCTFILN